MHLLKNPANSLFRQTVSVVRLLQKARWRDWLIFGSVVAFLQRPEPAPELTVIGQYEAQARSEDYRPSRGLIADHSEVAERPRNQKQRSKQEPTARKRKP